MTHPPYQILTAAVSDRGLSEKRPQNEDSYLELPDVGLFVVADGVGGAQAGEVASQTAVEVLSEAFRNVTGHVDVEDLMEIAIQRANSAIYQMSRDVPRLSSMATTLVALHIAGNVATIGHVGDSRLYRLDPNGDIFRETHDHSVVEEEVRAGRLTPEQAANHPSRNVISRALGADDSVEVDMKTVMFEPGTSFLLCSDGITRHASDAELRQVLISAHTPQQACAKLKEICFSRGAEDNLTAVVIKAETAFDGDEADTGELTISNIRPAVAETVAPVAVAVAAAPAGATYRMEEIRVPAAQPREEIIDDYPEPVVITRRRSLLGRMVMSLFLLALGAGGGAFGYYYYLKNFPLPEAAAPVQNPVLPSFAFEENRRSVDKGPAAYLQNRADKAVNAEDHYLNARALIQEKKYADAVAELQKAKQTLAMTGEENRKTLEIEIAAAFALASSKEAQASFERERPAAPTATNSAANSNSPPR